MVVPLITLQGECVGILNICRATGGKRYSDSDLEGAEAIARHLALAVDNASLVARHKADADRYAALADENRRVLDSLPSGVIALDRARRVVQANASALRLLGHPSNELPCDWDVFAKHLSSRGKAAVDESLAAATSGGESRVTIEEPDGRHLQLRASQGTDFGITLIIDDITHDIEIERELQRTRTLAEIGQMTSAIAHEIRNPLTSISGAAQMVMDEPTLDGARGWAKVVQQEALQLNSLCDEFLDFARGVALNLGETSVDSLVTDLILQMDAQLSESGIHVSFETGDQVPVILADKAKLSQAIRNLILNGAEAMPGGGELRIRTEARNNCVLIEVEDHGIGIPEENLARLFTPFFTTKSRGTGLGLCNVRRVIEAHEGTVEVTSRVGVGTKFTLCLPMRLRP
jgi:signal transduction histidine kinase